MTEVEVNEVLGFVCNVRTEVSSDNAMPSGVVLLVKLLLDVGSNIFFNIELLQGLCCAIDGILSNVCEHLQTKVTCYYLLHVLRHISVLNDGLSCFAHCSALQRDISTRVHTCKHLLKFVVAKSNRLCSVSLEMLRFSTSR